MAYLTVISSKGLREDMSGTNFQISGDTTIGRHDDSDVWIYHESVSREHCRILDRGEQCFIEDRSSYGTYLNGKKVESIEQLSDGDEFYLVSSSIVVFRYCVVVLLEKVEADDQAAPETVQIFSDQSV